MTTYEAIERAPFGAHLVNPPLRDALYVADETNCVQWMRAHEPEQEPFLEACAVGQPCPSPHLDHHWRKAYVIT